MKLSKCIALALVSTTLQACQAGNTGDAEGPYAEEADLLTICEQRPLESCETADELCHVLRALPIDVEQRCSRPGKPVACVPAPAADALVEPNAAACRMDAEGNTWAIGNLDAPPDWRSIAPEDDCKDMPHCED